MRQATDDPYARQRAEVKRLLRHDPDLASNHVALVSLIGSQAYGMATPDSDSDYRGVYVADPEILLGLDRPQPQFERKDPDITVFELGKFCELAMTANPNILEVLWGPTLHRSPLGHTLLAKRHLFATQQARLSYAGFAMSQLKRIERYDRNDRPEKRVKSARHLFRLFEQAEQLLTTGELDLRVSDPDELRRLSELPYSEIKDYFIDMDQWLRHLPSDLPERADREKISELVREIRIEELKEWGYHPGPPDSDW